VWSDDGLVYCCFLDLVPPFFELVAALDVPAAWAVARTSSNPASKA